VELSNLSNKEFRVMILKMKKKNLGEDWMSRVRS